MACLAILMAALAPTLTHAFRNERDDALASICSASATRGAGVPSGSSDQGSGSTHAGDACGYCSLHIPGGWIPTVASTAPVARLPAFEVPYFTVAAPPAEPAWQAPQSRAPPRLA
jgi:hypothetical protein